MRRLAKDLLRFITCGSVDDGKSTLIGRLLHDSKLIFEDQLSALADDSKRHGTTGEDIDFALLVDGLRGRARTGNHDRRRLSLLHDAQAFVHRRRYARARTIHAQHGDRSVELRSSPSSSSMRARAFCRRHGVIRSFAHCLRYVMWSSR